jgi:predicted RNase H-like HicB family nuclease
MPGYTYQWLDGTTIIPGATNISYTANTPGTHNYRIKVTNASGCSDTTASGLFPVVVYPSPVSTITASGPLSFCTGSSVILSVPFVSGYTYQWYYGTTVASASPIPGGTSSSYTASVTGYYYVKVTTPFGCTTNSSATPAQVTVVSLPYVTHTTPLTFCWGSHVTLSASVGTAPGITFQWKLNGVSIPMANADTFNANTTGLYTCEINVSSGSCVSTTAPVTVHVNPLPNPIITYAGSQLKTSTFYTSYQWYRNLVEISGATTYHIIPTTVGTYGVIVVDTNGCISAAATYPLTLIKLEADNINRHDLPVIYPNPASDKIYVQYSQNVRITITDIDGRVLFEKPSAKEIDISSLSQGIYIIALYDENNTRILVEKLIRQ